MSKVTGKPIKLGAAKALRNRAIAFATDAPIMAALQGITPSAKSDTRTFYNNLDCGFIFDRESLFTLLSKILAVPDSGLIMIMGASDDPTPPDPRINKPTLSIFACTIDKTAGTYSIIHPNPANEDDTDGTEHPGLVSLANNPGGKIERGEIKFLDV